MYRRRKNIHFPQLKEVNMNIVQNTIVVGRGGDGIAIEEN